MIARIELRNFKKFVSYSFGALAGNVLVGPNNAGKSSVLDALRLLETCSRFAKRRNPKSSLYSDGNYYPCYVVDEGLGSINIENSVNDYGDDDATIIYYLNNKSKIWICVHPERNVRMFIDAAPGRFTTTRHFRKMFDFSLVVVPTISVLETNEKVVDVKTLERNTQTRLASRAFRNIWYNKTNEEFDQFDELISLNWPGVQVQKPELNFVNGSSELQMYFREGRRDREISWSGFGFQAWLQIYTYLQRGSLSDRSVLVIDEPDIYIHSDLQKKLLDYIRSRFCQFFLATHSVEMINHAKSKEVVAVDSKNRQSRRVTRDEDFVSLMSYLGSSANFDVTRILKANKVIFVEGQDEKIFKRFAKRVGYRELAANIEIPFIQLGGFGQWKRAVDAIWGFKTIMQLKVDAIAIFDRDYRCNEEVAEFISSNENDQLKIIILDRKEIENYALDAQAITRVINHRCKQELSVSLEFVETLLKEVCDELKIETLSSLSTDFIRFKRGSGSRQHDNTLLREAMTLFEESWKDSNFRLGKISGKEALSRINKRLQGLSLPSVNIGAIIDQYDKDVLDGGFNNKLAIINDFCKI